MQAYFGRAWKVTLLLQSNGGQTVVLSSDQFTNPLRATFQINQRANIAYWDAQITLYNVNSQLLSTLQNTGLTAQLQQTWNFNQPISSGDQLTVSAGYKYSANGIFNPDTQKVYTGSVFQPIWTRENVTDYTVTLRCVVGLLQDALNPVNVSVSDGKTPYDLLQQLSDTSGVPVESADEAALSTPIFPRAKTLNGKPVDLLQRIAKDNDLTAWLGPGGLNIRSLKFDENTLPVVAYAPPNLPGTHAPLGINTTAQKQGMVKNTLIGTPEQTQDGVTFRVMMDSQPKIGSVIQIAPGTAINRLPFQIGTLPSILDKQGLYVVAGLRHVGDTRGEDWYTEITALTNTFFPNFASGS